MLLLLFSGFTVVIGAHLPPGVILCHQSDPNFSQCVGKNIEKAAPLFADGYKDLGVPSLDPFLIEHLELKSPPSQSTALQQIYRNVYIHGSTKCKIRNFEINIDKGCSWVTDMILPVVRWEADYEINGKILVFPLNAHGRCNVTNNNLKIRHHMTCEKYTKKSKTFLKIVNYTIDMEPGTVYFDFDNIFPENEEIAAQILKTLNDNSLSVFNEVKSGFEKVFSMIYINEGNRVFSQIPMNEIFLD